jgi:hypothetical protein
MLSGSNKSRRLLSRQNESSTGQNSKRRAKGPRRLRFEALEDRCLLSATISDGLAVVPSFPPGVVNTPPIGFVQVSASIEVISPISAPIEVAPPTMGALPVAPVTPPAAVTNPAPAQTGPFSLSNDTLTITPQAGAGNLTITFSQTSNDVTLTLGGFSQSFSANSFSAIVGTIDGGSLDVETGGLGIDSATFQPNGSAGITVDSQFRYVNGPTSITPMPIAIGNVANFSINGTTFAALVPFSLVGQTLYVTPAANDGGLNVAFSQSGDSVTLQDGGFSQTFSTSSISQIVYNATSGGPDVYIETGEFSYSRSSIANGSGNITVNVNANPVVIQFTGVSGIIVDGNPVASPSPAQASPFSLNNGTLTITNAGQQPDLAIYFSQGGNYVTIYEGGTFHQSFLTNSIKTIVDQDEFDRVEIDTGGMSIASSGTTNGLSTVVVNAQYSSTGNQLDEQTTPISIQIAPQSPPLNSVTVNGVLTPALESPFGNNGGTLTVTPQPGLSDSSVLSITFSPDGASFTAALGGYSQSFSTNSISGIQVDVGLGFHMLGADIETAGLTYAARNTPQTVTLVTVDVQHSPFGIRFDVPNSGQSISVNGTNIQALGGPAQTTTTAGQTSPYSVSDGTLTITPQAGPNNLTITFAPGSDFFTANLNGTTQIFPTGEISQIAYLGSGPQQTVAIDTGWCAFTESTDFDGSTSIVVDAIYAPSFLPQQPGTASPLFVTLMPISIEFKGAAFTINGNTFAQPLDQIAAVQSTSSVDATASSTTVDASGVALLSSNPQIVASITGAASLGVSTPASPGSSNTAGVPVAPLVAGSVGTGGGTVAAAASTDEDDSISGSLVSATDAFFAQL